MTREERALVELAVHHAKWQGAAESYQRAALVFGGRMDAERSRKEAEQHAEAVERILRVLGVREEICTVLPVPCANDDPAAARARPLREADQ